MSQNAITNTPLVILLHGVYGSHWAWALKGKVHETAQRLLNEGKIKPMILAMPSDGLFGDGSAYVPHQSENYEQWIVEDVPQVMQEQVACVSTNSPVFIAGLSMGGFGALRLGAKYPHLFTAFSGLSSITHFSQMSEFVADFEELENKALEKDGVLEWMLKNKTALPPFRFDCGSDDILIQPNRQLHTDLLSNKIPHHYEEFSGGHSWEYWATHIEKTLLFFNRFC
jgi:enterochelin esterase-like enzyme